MDLEYLDWGLLDYREALEKMRARHAARAAGQVADALICVEHPPTFTLGKHGNRDNILLSDPELAGLGLGLYWVERGGDVTLHSPGQAVVYLVVDLKANRISVRSLVDAVQGAACRTALEMGVRAVMDPERPGAWVGEAKLAAVGMAVPQKVTMHGVSFNVDNDLSLYGHIRACGMDAPATSLARELGGQVDFRRVHRVLRDFIAQGLGEVCGTFKTLE